MAIKSNKAKSNTASTATIPASLHPLLKIKDVCAILGIQPQTIYNGVSKGVFPIPVKRVLGGIRFKYSDVQAYLDSL